MSLNLFLSEVSPSGEHGCHCGHSHPSILIIEDIQHEMQIVERLAYRYVFVVFLFASARFCSILICAEWPPYFMGSSCLLKEHEECTSRQKFPPSRKMQTLYATMSRKETVETRPPG